MRYLMVGLVALMFSLAQGAEPTPADKDEAQAFLGLAKISRDKGEPDKALEWVSKSKEKMNSMEAEEMRALVQESQKKFNEARESFNNALTLPPLKYEATQRVQRKVDEIKAAMKEYETKRQEFLNVAKNATTSGNPYVADAAKADVKKLEPEKVKTTQIVIPPPVKVSEEVVEFDAGEAIVTLNADGTSRYTYTDDRWNNKGTVLKGNWTIKRGKLVITWSTGSVNVINPFTSEEMSITVIGNRNGSDNGSKGVWKVTKGSFPGVSSDF